VRVVNPVSGSSSSNIISKVRALVDRSSPDDGSIGLDRLVQKLRDDAAIDALGMSARLEGGDLSMSFPSSIVSGTNLDPKPKGLNTQT